MRAPRHERETRSRSVIRRAVLSLCLTALMGLVFNAASPSPAQASSGGRPNPAMVYTFNLSAEQAGSYALPVCLNQEVTFVVRGWLSGRDQAQNRTIARHPVPGVRLSASPSAGLKVVSADRQIRASVDPYMGAKATFKAVKTGPASVTFRGTLMPKFGADDGVPPEARRKGLRHEVTATVDVIECPLAVRIVDRSEIKAGPYSIDLVGALPEVVLRQAGGDPNLFQGEGIMPFVMRQFAPPAGVTITVGTRLVQIQAGLSGGVYSFTITKGVMNMVGTWTGGRYSVSQPLPFPEPEPILFTMRESDIATFLEGKEERMDMPGMFVSGTVYVRKLR